jgi:hypothetical protein
MIYACIHLHPPDLTLKELILIVGSLHLLLLIYNYIHYLAQLIIVVYSMNASRLLS